jgi:threonine-phosphate decarboxylase
MKPYDIGISPVGPSRKVKAAIRKALKNINRGSRDAQERFEQLLLSRYGLGHDNLLFANSLKELVYAIPQTLKARKVLIIGPAVNLYGDAACFAGAQIEFREGRDEAGYMPDLSVLGEKGGSFDMVYMASPNRITGKAMDEGKLREAIERLSDGTCKLVIDESLIEFTQQNSLMEQVWKKRNIIVLRTTAFYYGLAGLELAVAASSGEVIAALRECIHGELHLPAVVAARAAIKDTAFRRMTNKFIEDERRLLQRAVSGLQGVGLYGSDSNVLLFKHHPCMAAVVRTARKAGLAAELYEGRDGSEPPLLRISIMRHEHNLQLIKILKKVCAEEE